MLTTHKTTVVRSRIESDLKNCATEVLPFEIRTPNATTLAAMKEARSMGKAKFDSAPALFHDLEKTTPKKTRKPAAKQR